MAETLGSLVDEAAGSLSAVRFEEPRRQARRLVASALAISQTELFSCSDRPVDPSQAGRLRAMLGRMIEHEPLSRILGRREFWGLDFALSAATLDPRPETETIVEAVLRRKPDRLAPLRILDLGTGTGCLLLALLGEYPEAIGFGIDIAEEAVRTAACNAARLGFAARARFFVGDWSAAVSGRFDVIVANPPYIATEDLPSLPSEVALYDPPQALDGGGDGLVPCRAIAAMIPSLLPPNGIFVCEVGVGQAAAVQAILRVNGVASDEIEKDLGGIARCVIGRLLINRDRSDREKGWNASPSRLG
jgi:release factor glutamine methyltransferase